MIAVIIILALGVLLLVISEIKTRKWMKAFDLHRDMFDKYVELTKDPFMDNVKWKKWLPIFEEADRICTRDCPNMKIEPISLKIKHIINDEESIQG